MLVAQPRFALRFASPLQKSVVVVQVNILNEINVLDLGVILDAIGC
jgi:hypothetical protein